MPNPRRLFRESIGATLLDVAELIGVSKQAVSMWERGVSDPSGKNEAKWVAALRSLESRSARSRGVSEWV